MDLRGKQSKTQANREHSFMSKVFSWGYQRGKVTGNPCKGVDKYTESNRDRYITDKEYSAVLEFANPLLFAAMEISYCCAARQGDVLKLSPQQLLEEGIYIKQGKTGKAQIKAWSNRLKKAVELARSQNKIPSIKWIIADEGGQKISGNRLRHWYRQAKEKAAEKHPDLSFDFTFHDIKAKSISDIEGNIHEKQEISGHLTASQVAVYDRKAKVVKTHD
jgi:integrase